jgi:hypothetical protein
LQPYSANNGGKEDVLWCLSELDNIDKHRLLIVTAMKFRPVSFTVTVPSGEQFAHEISSGEWKELVSSAEIMRFDLSKAIKQPGKVNVKIRTANVIQIENTGTVCDGMAIEVVLSDCIQHCINIVGKFSEQFFT